jgi:hypothetical protein
VKYDNTFTLCVKLIHNSRKSKILNYSSNRAETGHHNTPIYNTTRDTRRLPKTMVVPSPPKFRSVTIPECGILSAETDGKIGAVYLYVIALVAALGGFVHGYGLSLISGAVIFLDREFSLSPFWCGAFWLRKGRQPAGQCMLEAGGSA